MSNQEPTPIQRFRSRFGKGHVYLACHAALPLAIAPNLLESIWTNFQQDIHGQPLHIPWVAISDLLLSGLFEEVGNELYEMEDAVRNYLIAELVSDQRLGLHRQQELIEFLLPDVENRLGDRDSYVQSLAQTQHWGLIAYQSPADAARAITSQLGKLHPEDNKDNTEWLRMTKIVDALTPLQDFAEYPRLRSYLAAMAAYSQDRSATTWPAFSELLDASSKIKIIGYDLPLPASIREKHLQVMRKRKLSRRNFLYLGLAGIGGGVAITFNQSNQKSLKLTNIQFASVRLNDRGEIIDRPQGSAAVFIEELDKGTSLVMVKIPAGQFMMGQSKAESSKFTPVDKAGQSRSEYNEYKNELPQHLVQVPEFYVGQTLVTQAQWQAIMGNNPSYFKGDGNLPVENVSWLEAMEFCDKLSKRTKKIYRFPTEAEWEYACRANTTTPFAFGETISPAVVNYNGEYPYGNAAKGAYRGKTTVVGSFPPNGFGLYDMHGNLWEWCWDEYVDNYNDDSARSDIKFRDNIDGSVRGDIKSREDSKERPIRGGSWFNDARYCRSARRVGLPAANRPFNDNVGLRVVWSPSSTPSPSEFLDVSI